MRVIIAGGGTGGHVFPAVAVAEEFIHHGANVLFVGTNVGLEAEVIPKKGWKIEYIPARKWKGQSRLSRIAAIFSIPLAIFRGMKIIKKFKPDMVIGVGGYVSLPLVLAAVLKMKKTLIMEQNAIPGLTNRFLGKFVSRVCLTYPGSEKFFASKKSVITGNPVRSEIHEVPDHLPSFQERFVVMVYGGSQGAKSINEAFLASLRHLKNRSSGISIIHVVGGSIDIDLVKDIYKREGFEAEVHRFLTNMEDSYARTHLVICRAGATSIAELTVASRPAVLVPYPYAANDHQKANADYIVEKGGALVVNDKDLNGERIAEIIIDFMNQPEKLEAMSKIMKKIAHLNAAKNIVKESYLLVG